MKKLISNIHGGAPFSLDYLGFIDSKINDLMSAFASLNPAGFIITGCVVSRGASTWQVSAGWVSILGEVYYVPAGDTGLANSGNPANELFWNVSQTVAAPSPHQYHDLSVQNDTFERVAILNTTGSLFPYDATPPFNQLVSSLVIGTRAWINIGSAGNPAFTNSWNSNNPALRISKDNTGMVFIDGTTYNGSNANNNTSIFTLPAGFRPTQDIQKVVRCYQGGYDTTGFLEISTNGSVGVNILNWASGSASVYINESFPSW